MRLEFNRMVRFDLGPDKSLASVKPGWARRVRLIPSLPGSGWHMTTAGWGLPKILTSYGSTIASSRSMRMQILPLTIGPTWLTQQFPDLWRYSTPCALGSIRSVQSKISQFYWAGLRFLTRRKETADTVTMAIAMPA